MMRRKSMPESDGTGLEPKGFDDFELTLGDVMRGERATLGKSLLDVQRELRIKANYIAAIENCDTEAFDTPGFIAGYVRSYARYLGMDPDRTFAKFCEESGFANARSSTNLGGKPGTVRKLEGRGNGRKSGLGAGTFEKDPFITPSTPFVPARDGFLSRIEPAAIGSGLVLLALICGLAYGGYAVLSEFQRVQFAPVENTPDVLSDLDPVSGVKQASSEDPVPNAAADQAAGVFNPPSSAVDRLYRPKALDVPVVVSRDAPIATLNPAKVGTLASADVTTIPQAHKTVATPEDRAMAIAMSASASGGDTAAQNMSQTAPQPQVVADPKPGVTLVAVRPAWVQVKSADGTVLLEKTMQAGETYKLPNTEEPPLLRAGMSGSVYFKVGGKYYGPAGQGSHVVSHVNLSEESVKNHFKVADLSQDPVAEQVISVARADLDDGTAGAVAHVQD